ncbi:18081_t:CDS:2 [Rhizophagus irregularis]|nr:18081_t:CDS:2 [Rhizophagus irregularis]
MLFTLYHVFDLYYNGIKLFESLDVENAKVAKSSEIAKSAKIVISELEDIIMSPKS